MTYVTVESWEYLEEKNVVSLKFRRKIIVFTDKEKKTWVCLLSRCPCRFVALMWVFSIINTEHNLLKICTTC